MRFTKQIQFLPALCLPLLWQSCGYIGDPLPPTLEIPLPVANLTVSQSGAKLLVQYDEPKLTTEGTKLKGIEVTELRIGKTGTGEFNADKWASTAGKYQTPPAIEGHVEFEIPTKDLEGQTMVAAVRTQGTKGRYSAWSNIVVVPVSAPLTVPTGFTVKGVNGGVQLSWQSISDNSYRVFRDGKQITETAKAEFLDSGAAFGKTLAYTIQAIRKSEGGQVAVSPVSEPVNITPVDTFPPEAPKNLQLIQGVNSIEITWERSLAEDWKSYRVYRSEAKGTWQVLVDSLTATTYSDRSAQRGKTYRYTITALDAAGNESEKSQPMELGLPE